MKRIVLTGGPSAGKTAVQQVAAGHFGDKIVIAPEAATMLFSGGFPQPQSKAMRRAAQRAIYYVQRELEEALMEAAGPDATLLCDRGTADGAAYWEGEPDFFTALGTTREAEHARYHTVIHLSVPPAGGGYNLHNPTRTESPARASEVDQGIGRAWAGHPRLHRVGNQTDFVHKLERAIEIIRDSLAD